MGRIGIQVGKTAEAVSPCVAMGGSTMDVGETVHGSDSMLRSISLMPRVRASGKFFKLGHEEWAVKGFTYGPFAPRAGDAAFLPPMPRLLDDLRHMRRLGANCIRLYHVPDRQFLDCALEADLRVFIDVPWDKHRCFFEDYAAQTSALRRLRHAARELGRHPATFAISAANEIPKDVVRFYGALRVERFIDRLLDTVKQEAPECLTTYTNFPSTEFLAPACQDFFCFNVYLEDGDVLSRYLDHLQHVAGPRPIILGEYGIDSFRHGEQKQAAVLQRHIQETFGRGLAGSFVFSFTDAWYTGGAWVGDWAFGVTDSNRQEKPAAIALRDAWQQVRGPVDVEMPMVSVVVCTYNGAATLRECMEALLRLEYPNYEIILVDDGSTDDTPRIAADFPSVRYIRQDNMGLSRARNTGAEAATGEIVAFTDDDCMAHEAWLTYLLRAMEEQKVEVMGGPNVPPPTDGWVAKCVAASPGGPSHVMFDDHLAEHVPGCNMAFKRDRLLALGGFDARFRVAGDDVDICWRFMDAGMSIGYTPSALVWHHRRKSVRAYLKQQQGYGRSEALLRFKHPERFNRLGCSQWHGVIYGEGAVGLPVCAPVVYHGRHGSGLFQTIYHRNDYSSWGYVVLLEWHALAALIAVIGLVAAPALLVVSAVMWCATLVAAVRSAQRAPLAKGGRWWCRPLVFILHLAQPPVRSWSRYCCRLRNKRLPQIPCSIRRVNACRKRVSWGAEDLDFDSRKALGREHILEALQSQATKANWTGQFDGEWWSHDVELVGDVWHDLRIHTATEELGNDRRFTRVRYSVHATGTTWMAGTSVMLWSIAAFSSGRRFAEVLSLLFLSALLACWLRSRWRCHDTVARLVWSAGQSAGLDAVPIVQKSNNAGDERNVPLDAELEAT